MKPASICRERTESTRFLSVRADGTCSWSSRTESGGSVRGRDSLGNESWTAGYAGTGGDSDRGTWSAGSGKLYVMWQNGSLSEWTYRVSGSPGSRRLLLQGAGIWNLQHGLKFNGMARPAPASQSELDGLLSLLGPALPDGSRAIRIGN